TLQTGDKAAIRRVLLETQELMVHTGPDLLRRYLVQHTRYEDYDGPNRSAFLFALGKEALLAGNEQKAVGYLSGMSASSPLWPFALQLRGSAQAMLQQNERALADFRRCQSVAGSVRPAASGDDLEARCTAGEARTLYQMGRFEDADQAYDQIPKSSLVWPDILFEQAWNAFARHEYNRALGKLVSYKSPALEFVFNPEVGVLRAQSYLALCLYGEANETINEFNSRYAKVGEKVKEYVESNSSNLAAFHAVGKEALRGSLYSRNPVHRLLNRFVRAPYFQTLVRAEESAAAEVNAIRRFDAMQPGVSHDLQKGFPGFLSQVLRWRAHSARMLGGAFVKNSLLDHHAELLSDFDKMSFIKLEMLKRAKEQLILNRSSSERGWGNSVPSRRDYQYRWGFNGEFWNDELGDYVFGLESECRGNDAK
ncbi:MAG: hypothetical protein NDJ90_16265, partial [Oligoflexia bacterium]|nr:hypothetical protein [Oligoflexia bacterium]